MVPSLLLAAALLSGSPVAGRNPLPPARTERVEANSRVASGRAIAHYLRARLLDQAGDHEGAVAALRLAAAHDPQSAEIQVALAEALSRAGRGDEAEERAQAAVGLAPGSVAASDALTVVGRLRAARGDVLAATAALESALAVQRTLAQLGVAVDPRPWRLLGELRLGAGDEPAALAIFEELSGRLPGEGSGFRLVGMLHEDRGDHAGAERWLERALEADPTDADARRRLARVHEALRRLPEARDDLVALLRVEPDDEEALLSLGRLALRGDDPASAREWLARLRRSATDPADAALRVALVWLDAGFPEEGLAAARAARADLGPRSRVLFAEGVALQELHRYREAVAAFRQVAPAEAELHRLATDSLAFSLARAGDPAEADRVISRGLASHPGDPRLVARRAWLLQRAGKAPAAIRLLQATLADRAGRAEAGGERDAAADADLWQALSEAFEWDGRPGDVLVPLQRAAEAAPRDVDLLYVLGSAFERAGRSEIALAQMRAILVLDPDHAGAMNFIGYSLAERGERLDEAEGLVKRALEARPRSGGFLDSLGWIAFQRGDYSRSVELLERASQLVGPDPIVLDHLADAYRASRRPADADGAWRRALRCADELPPADAGRLRAAIDRKLRGDAAAAR